MTVCDRASESCPVFPGLARRIHWSFEDPSGLRTWIAGGLEDPER